MTQKYRTDDETRWGDGIGRNLEPAEVDINFWEIIERLVDLEARPLPSAEIDEFSIVGNALYITLTDDTVKGPYILPTSTLVARGEWTPATVYSVMDTFTANGKLYQVVFAHTSEATFDANANDGLGHDFYSLMLEAPSNVLPTGGAVGQVVTKSTADDFAVMWSWKFPTGGTAGQFLRKVSGAQDDAEWAEPDASEIGFVPATGSALTSDNVGDAIEEAASRTGAFMDLTDVSPTTDLPVPGTLFYWDGEALVPTDEPEDGNFLKWFASPGGWFPTIISFTDIHDAPSAEQTRPTGVTALAGAAPWSLDPTLGNVFTIVPPSDGTINAASTPAGAEIVLIITTTGATSRTLTFGTGFISQGTLATGTVSGKRFVVKFASIGSTFYEISRTAAY